jgi:O-acetylserine/cysteine efflux transporter
MSNAKVAHMRPGDMFLALLVALIWGFNFVPIKTGLLEVPPLLFCASRYVLILPILSFMGRGSVPWRTILLYGVIQGCVGISLLYLGINAGMPVGLSSVIAQTQAVFSLILSAIVLKVHPTKAQWAGCCVALAGVAMMGGGLSGHVHVVGLVLVLASAISWAVGNLVQRTVDGEDALRLVVWSSLVPPVPLTLLSLAVEKGQWQCITHLSTPAMLSIAYNGLVSTLMGAALWGKLLARYPLGTVAPWSLLVPVIGVACSVLFLGESMSPTKLLMALVVVAGLLMVVAGDRMYAKLRVSFAQ